MWLTNAIQIILQGAFDTKLAAGYKKGPGSSDVICPTVHGGQMCYRWASANGNLYPEEEPEGGGKINHAGFVSALIPLFGFQFEVK